MMASCPNRKSRLRGSWPSSRLAGQPIEESTPDCPAPLSRKTLHSYLFLSASVSCNLLPTISRTPLPPIPPTKWQELSSKVRALRECPPALLEFVPYHSSSSHYFSCPPRRWALPQAPVFEAVQILGPLPVSTHTQFSAD